MRNALKRVVTWQHRRKSLSIYTICIPIRSVCSGLHNGKTQKK